MKLDNSYLSLPGIFYTKQLPERVSSPEIVLLNESLIENLGLNIEFFKSTEGIDILSGKKIIDGTEPISQAYAGHQFGYFTMLGDGRAVLLGEYTNSNGETFDIQLKGSGRTTYSRGGDGKAALGPMLREYIISEGMHALGIPTTRSLAVVKTGDKVYRENILEGAILTRIAASHIRVGTFQFAANWGSINELKALADYTINRHYKECEKEEKPYLALLKKVIDKQAKLISKWQLVGFIHGVMNTDNMTISGETIDYGPCAFMDTYDPKTVFSSIDTNGRYAYGNQPNMALWNLVRFAETLIPLIDDDSEKSIELAQNEISRFPILFKEYWISGMRKKLGFFNEEKEDEYLIEGLLSIMEKYKADYTDTFRLLTIGELNDNAIFTNDDFKTWYNLWQDRLKRQNENLDLIKRQMEQNNPNIIPRNHIVEEALEGANRNDFSKVEKLIKAIQRPYDYSNNNEYFIKLPQPSSCPYRTFCGT